MKKLIIFTALLLSACWHPVYAEEGPCIEMLYITGDVQVSKGDGPFAAATAGMLLEPWDKIKTGADSSADLSFDADDKNIVKIGSSANVVVVLKEDERLELINGDVYCTINNLPQGSSFEVRTPTAIAGVRGTDIRIEADAENTVVEAVDNNAFIRNKLPDGTFSAKETVIQPGFMANVKKNEPPSRPMPIPRERMEHHVKVKGDMLNRARQVRLERKPPARMLRRGPGPGETGPGGPQGPQDGRPGPEKSVMDSRYGGPGRDNIGPGPGDGRPDRLDKGPEEDKNRFDKPPEREVGSAPKPGDARKTPVVRQGPDGPGRGPGQKGPQQDRPRPPSPGPARRK